jgi:hypothetical protein
VRSPRSYLGTSFNWFRKQQNEGTVPEFAQLWCGRQAIISNHGTVLFTIRVRRSTSKYGIGWLGFNASFWRSCRSESSEPAAVEVPRSTCGSGAQARFHSPGNRRAANILYQSHDDHD